MQCMKACQKKVENKKHLCVPQVGAIPLEPWPGHFVLDPVVVILVAFNREKADAEEHRDQQTSNQPLLIACAGSVDSESNEQACGDQDGSVQCSCHKEHVNAAGTEGLWICEAVGNITGNHSTEK